MNIYTGRCIFKQLHHAKRIRPQSQLAEYCTAKEAQKNQVSISSLPVAPTELKRKPKSKIAFINWINEDFLKGAIKLNAYHLYCGMTDQTDYFLFFKLFNMDDTFNSWFLITELHIWLLLARLRSAGKDGKVAMKTLSVAFWEDCTSRAKALSPGDSSTSKKQIQTLSEEFKASLLIYDEGLLDSDMVLASALWYRFFGKSCDDPRNLELLVAYVRNQMQNLDTTTTEDILLRGNIKWIPLSQNLPSSSN